MRVLILLPSGNSQSPSEGAHALTPADNGTSVEPETHRGNVRLRLPHSSTR